MEIKVHVETDPFVQKQLGKLGVLGELAFRLGVQNVHEFLRDYHSGMDWKGSRWMAGRDSGAFAKQVVEGWQPPVISRNRAEITNTFGLLAWKVSGGTITPKRAKFLTIPLVSEAKGVSAAFYAGMTGSSLFRAGNALCRRIGKQLEAIYALKQSVTQAPWPGAMPPQDRIQEVFIAGMRESVEEQLK